MAQRKILLPPNLEVAFQKLDLSKLPASHKRALKRLASVHVNPDAQKVDVVVRAMRRGRRGQVLSAKDAVLNVLDSVGTRGAKRLKGL